MVYIENIRIYTYKYIYIYIYTGLLNKTNLSSGFQSMIRNQVANWGLKLYFGLRTKKSLKN